MRSGIKEQNKKLRRRIVSSILFVVDVDVDVDVVALQLSCSFYFVGVGGVVGMRGSLTIVSLVEIRLLLL